MCLSFVADVLLQEGLWWGRPCACKGSQSQVPTDRYCLLRGASDLARRRRQEGKKRHGGLKGRGGRKDAESSKPCALCHTGDTHSQLLMDHLVKKNGQRVMAVTAHHDNLRPPFMKKHLSPDKPKGHGERRLQQSGGMWSLFSYSLWSSFYFVIICVFVPYNYVLMMCCVLA